MSLEFPLRHISYSQRWKEKQQWCRDHRILPREEGGGPNGTLVTTRDEPDGGINSQATSNLVKEVFGS